MNIHKEFKKNDKKIAEELNYDGIPVEEKDFSKTEIKNNICINVFGYEKKSFTNLYFKSKI